MEKVLVTGATGYIGLHCVDQLLKQGYAVNGSVRSPERKDEIFEALKKNNTPTDNLNIFTFNLTEDAGWDEGMMGCDYVLHVASPISLDAQDEEYFVGPAVAGVERALKFAKKHQVKKVVLTSSVAAIFETTVLKQYYDESDWSDPNKPEINHYAKSKTLAEMAAWDFVKNEGNPFEFAVINPALVIGPSLSGDLGESNKAISLLKFAKNFAVHLGRFIFGALLKPFFLKSLATSLYHRSFSERANLSPLLAGFCIAKIWAAATSLTST